MTKTRLKKFCLTLIPLMLVLAISVSATVCANTSTSRVTANLNNASFPTAEYIVSAGTTLYINTSCSEDLRMQSWSVAINDYEYYRYSVPSANYFRYDSTEWTPSAGEYAVYIEIIAKDGTVYSATRYVTVTGTSGVTFSGTYTYGGNAFDVVPNFDLSYAYDQHDYDRFINAYGSNHGCTATAMATAYSIYHNTVLSPNDVKWCSSGTYWEYMEKYQDGTKTYHGNTFTGSEGIKAIGACVNSGKPVVFYVNGLGINHVVTAVGIRQGADLSNLSRSDVLIADPLDGTVKALDSYTSIDTSGALRIPIG